MMVTPTAKKKKPLENSFQLYLGNRREVPNCPSFADRRVSFLITKKGLEMEIINRLDNEPVENLADDFEISEREEDGILVLEVPMLDDSAWCRAHAKKRLLAASDFIQQAYLQAQSVYVHCHSGVSRSVRRHVQAVVLRPLRLVRGPIRWKKNQRKLLFHFWGSQKKLLRNPSKMKRNTSEKSSCKHRKLRRLRRKQKLFSNAGLRGKRVGNRKQRRRHHLRLRSVGILEQPCPRLGRSSSKHFVSCPGN